jgi:hypothetical protein
MKKGELDISKETYSGFLKLAGYQIIGGTLGAAMIIWTIISRFSTLETGTLSIFLFMSVFYLFSFYCGIKCIQAKENALKYSLINQYLQLAGIAVFGFAFNYIAGLYLTLEFDMTEALNFNLGFGISKFALLINTESETVALSINIVALLLIIWINKLKKKVRAEMEAIETATIGIDLIPQSIE